MIPIHDDVGAPRLSPVNTCLIAANVAVYGYEVSLGPAVAGLLATFGMAPARLAALLPPGALAGASWAQDGGGALLTLLTSLFLHGGILHLAGNMFYLFIFGPAVEQRFGARRYLSFYLVGGIIASLVLTAMDPRSAIPVIGASGAIAAVLGAYLVLYPRARLTTVLPLLILIEIVEVPAVLYLILWFGLQLYAALHSGGGTLGGAVAWWSHVGGFMFGLAAAPFLAYTRKRVAV